MTTVKDAMDTVALQCAIALPNSWIAAVTRRTYQEIHSILGIVIDELHDRLDWPDPITKDVTITGTGVEAYDLPADFKRLTHDTQDEGSGAVFETTMNRRACIPVTTNGIWTNLKEYGSAGGARYYRTGGTEESGHTISFFQELETGSEVVVSYVSKNWLVHEGAEGFEWNSDEDTLLFPRRLVELGTVWRWKQRKGLPFASEYSEYEGKLARLANEARGKRTICFGGGPKQINPFNVPIPDYIPSS